MSVDDGISVLDLHLRSAGPARCTDTPAGVVPVFNVVDMAEIVASQPEFIGTLVHPLFIDVRGLHQTQVQKIDQRPDEHGPECPPTAPDQNVAEGQPTDSGEKYKPMAP